MMLMLILSILFELLLYLAPGAWRIKSFFVAGAVCALSFWAGTLIGADVSKFALILLFITLFRYLNLFKITKATIHPDYLKRVTRRTSLILSLATLLIITTNSFVADPYLSQIVGVLSIIAFISALMLLAFTSKNLQATKHHVSKHYYTDKELPTVTVAIPARNETNDMAACLRTVLANDYPKLEILVLDDCSQDRTAEVIKDFAHDGVRFISGKPPKDRWLAKNQAYQELANHASGEVILFCGVDVRFGPQAIRSLVTTMLNKEKKMISVMPFRIGGGVDTSLIQPLRYWWEIALPRKFFNRPPVLSTCWLINRKSLLGLGAFKGVSHNIIPERYFARELITTNDYSFIRSDTELDVRTVKVVEEQLATAIRTRYPQLKKRPENVLFLVACQLIVIGLPLVLSFSVLWQGLTAASLLGLLSTGLVITTHYLIMSASNPAHSIIALFNLPFALVTDTVLTLYSMLQYEFGKVDWKGRNVCIPAMHVVPKLPDIK